MNKAEKKKKSKRVHWTDEEMDGLGRSGEQWNKFPESGVAVENRIFMTIENQLIAEKLNENGCVLRTCYFRPRG